MRKWGKNYFISAHLFSSPSLLSILTLYKVFIFNHKLQVVKDAFGVMGKQHSIPREAATSPNRALDHSGLVPVINRGKER